MRKSAIKSINRFADPIIPIVTENNINAIKYADEILAKDKIQDIQTCTNIFDDNYGVRRLGYPNCNTAYADYLSKNLDTSKLYGFNKSLNNYCPITTKNPMYMNCMRNLLGKFSANASIFESVNNDMTNLINKRLQDRTDIMNNIELTMNPYIGSNSIREFKVKTGLLDNSNQGSDELLYKANLYYQNKYGSKPIIEGFDNNAGSIVVDPYIIANFFGNYTPVKGQFLAFDNITISLDFDKTITTTKPNVVNSNLESASNTVSNSNSGRVLLIINDNSTTAQIIYKIDSITTYESRKNVIEVSISSQTINTTTSASNQNLQQLLSILGLTIPTKIIIMISQKISEIGVTIWTYKIMSINMDTIMVLKKIGK
jgi:hypothetical protein